MLGRLRVGSRRDGRGHARGAEDRAGIGAPARLPGWILEIRHRHGRCAPGRQPPNAPPARPRPRARGRGQVLAATSSDGGGVAIVGLGARGCAVVDRLVSRGALRRAQFWSLGADPNALQTALAPNRWRLPPGTVDPKDSAVEENAEAVSRGILGGGVANEPPAVVVVVASASEMVGAPLVTLEAVARLKDGPSQRGWFNVGGSQGITHRGPALIVAAMTPFAFEGPRKSADAVEALLAAQKRADAVTVVPQEPHPGGVAANGDPLTVAEVTELADATAQSGARGPSVEMFKSPAWIGRRGRVRVGLSTESKSRNRAWKYENALSPIVRRPGRGAAEKRQAGVRRVRGQGTARARSSSTSPDQGRARGDPCRRRRRQRHDHAFLRGARVFANAEFVCVSVQTQATLTEAAVRAASDALAELVGVDVPQIVTAAKPDPRAPPDQVLVTLLVAAQPEDAAARDPRRRERRGGEDALAAGHVLPPPFQACRRSSLPRFRTRSRERRAPPRASSPWGARSAEEREAREEKARRRRRRRRGRRRSSPATCCASSGWETRRRWSRRTPRARRGFSRRRMVATAMARRGRPSLPSLPLREGSRRDAETKRKRKSPRLCPCLQDAKPSRRRRARRCRCRRPRTLPRRWRRPRRARRLGRSPRRRRPRWRPSTNPWSCRYLPGWTPRPWRCAFWSSRRTPPAGASGTGPRPRTPRTRTTPATSTTSTTTTSATWRSANRKRERAGCSVSRGAPLRC